MSEIPVAQGKALLEPDQQERSTGHYVFVLIVVLLMAETTVYGATLFVSALTYMTPPLTPAELPWVVSITLLIAAALQPLMGKLADVFGRKRLMMLVAIVFIIGSLIGALTTSAPLLLLARALQASAVAMPGIMYSFFREYLPKRMVPVAVGMNSTNIGLAALIGPFIAGGLLAEFHDYHTMFWFCAIYMAVFAPIAYFVIPETKRSREGRKIDALGSALFTFGALIFLVGVSDGGSMGWSKPLTFIPLVVGAVLLVAFVFAELNVREPMISMRVLAAPAMRSTLLVSVFAGAAQGAWLYLVPQMLETPSSPRIDYGFGLSALQVAVVTASLGLMAMVSGPVGGQLTKRYSPRSIMLVACVVDTVMPLLLGFFHTGIWEFVVFGFVMGIANGCYYAAGPNLVIEAVPEELTGVSTGLQSFTSAFSTSVMPVVLGVVLAANVLSAGAHGTVLYASKGYTYSFIILSVLALIALVQCLRMKHGRKPATGGAVSAH